METATYSVTVQVENEEHERAYQANLKEAQERHKDSKGARRIIPQNAIDSMDVDEPASDVRLRNRKYVASFFVLCASSFSLQITGRRGLEAISKEA